MSAISAADVAVAVVTLKMGDLTTPDGELRAKTPGQVVAHPCEVRRLMEDHAWSQYGSRSEGTAVRSGEQRLEQLAAR